MGPTNTRAGEILQQLLSGPSEHRHRRHMKIHPPTLPRTAGWAGGGEGGRGSRRVAGEGSGASALLPLLPPQLSPLLRPPEAPQQTSPIPISWLMEMPAGDQMSFNLPSEIDRQCSRAAAWRSPREAQLLAWQM